LSRHRLKPNIAGFKSGMQHLHDVVSTLGFEGEGRFSVLNGNPNLRHLREVSDMVPPDMEYWTTRYVHRYEGPPAAMPYPPFTYNFQVRTARGYETRSWTFR
jgi:hypothetical protein